MTQEQTSEFLIWNNGKLIVTWFFASCMMSDLSTEEIPVLPCPPPDEGDARNPKHQKDSDDVVPLDSAFWINSLHSLLDKKSSTLKIRSSSSFSLGRPTYKSSFTFCIFGLGLSEFWILEVREIKQNHLRLVRSFGRFFFWRLPSQNSNSTINGKHTITSYSGRTFQSSRN